MLICATMALLAAAFDGSLSTAPMRTDPVFGFEVPTEVPGIDASILDPRTTWADKDAYDAQAAALADMFVENFTRFETHVDADVREAAPEMRSAAE